MMIKEIIDAYLESKKNSWSPTTIKSEGSRLKAIADAINGKPEELWAEIASRKPYTRRTTLTRVSSFWKWACTSGHILGSPTVYAEWEKANSRLMANSYSKERLTLTFKEAMERIGTLQDPAIKRRAMEILSGAMRYSESGQPIGDTVVGKGGKIRPDFRVECVGPVYTGSYFTFYRALKAVGLKPHMLRKLALTRMVDKGASIYDLMEVAGWSTPATASSYIQPKQTDKLKKLLA